MSAISRLATAALRRSIAALAGNGRVVGIMVAKGNREQRHGLVTRQPNRLTQA